jgi:hypothetical protein
MEGHQPAAELIPGAQIEPAKLKVRGPAERGIEVSLIEQPSPADAPAGKPAGAGERLHALDVEVEIGGGLVGTQ